MQPIRSGNSYADHTVLTADGDEVGVVEAVLTDDVTEPHLVIKLSDPDAVVGAAHVYIPSRAIATVTDGDVVLGSTLAWLAPNGWTKPPPPA